MRHIGPGARRRRVAGLAGLAATGVIIVSVLAFGVFGVHTLVIDREVSEVGPDFASGASARSAAPREAARGTFTSVDHPGEGTVVVLTDGTQAFVRFEGDFATDNGPDLHVTVAVAGQRVELGRLKGNLGAQNYELHTGIDPDAIENVSVWCKRFDSTFTIARLS